MARVLPAASRYVLGHWGGNWDAVLGYWDTLLGHWGAYWDSGGVQRHCWSTGEVLGHRTGVLGHCTGALGGYWGHWGGTGILCWDTAGDTGHWGRYWDTMEVSWAACQGRGQ